MAAKPTPGPTPVHRCTERECCFFGQPTSDSCRCHRTAEQLLLEQRDDLLAALKALHSCHRAFSGAEDWTALDDEARREAEAALAKAEGR